MISHDEVITIESRLEKMRAGIKNELKIKLGEFEIPVRLLPSSEELKVIQTAKMEVAKSPPQFEFKLVEAMAVMKGTLAAVAGQYLPVELLNQLTTVEIEGLYDQYQSVCRSINPNYEKLSDEDATAMIAAVKKKEQKVTDFYTYQLAGIGRFFLEAL